MQASNQGGVIFSMAWGETGFHGWAKLFELNFVIRKTHNSLVFWLNPISLEKCSCMCKHCKCGSNATVPEFIDIPPTDGNGISWGLLEGVGVVCKTKILWKLVAGISQGWGVS